MSYDYPYSKHSCETCQNRGKNVEKCPYDYQLSCESGGDLVYEYIRPEEVNKFIHLCGCDSYKRRV